MNRIGGHLLTAGILASLTLTGCVQRSRGLPLQEQEHVITTFATGQIRLADDYLILPISAERMESHGPILSFKSPSGVTSMFSGSAWTGPGFDRFTAFDFEVVEVNGGQHARIFGQHVATALWRDGFFTEERDKRIVQRLRFPGQLMLSARTQDASNNGYIGAEDPLWMFRYDLTAHTLHRISPDSYDLLEAHIHGKDILMILSHQDNHKSIAIYRYSPSNDAGKFLVEGMMP